MTNVLKFLFLFATKMLVIKGVIHKMLIRKANREDPDQTASSEVCTVCLSLFGRHIVFEILVFKFFRTFTVIKSLKKVFQLGV